MDNGVKVHVVTLKTPFSEHLLYSDTDGEYIQKLQGFITKRVTEIKSNKCILGITNVIDIDKIYAGKL